LKSQFRKVWDLLNKKERRQLSLVTILYTLSGLTDMLGVASIFPFLSVAASPELLKSNAYLLSIQTWTQVTDKQFLVFLGLLSLTALLVNQLVRLLSTWYGQFIAQRIWFNLHRRMFRYYLNQPYIYHVQHSGNALLEKLQVRTNAAVAGVIHPYFMIMSSLFSTLFTISLLVWIEPLMTLTLLGVMVLFYFLVYKRLKSRLDYYGKISPEFSQKSFKLINEAFAGIKEIKIRRNSETYLDIFEPAAKKYCDAQVKIHLFGEIPRGLVEVAAFGGILLITILMISESGGFQLAIPVLGMYALAMNRVMPSAHNIYYQIARIRFHSPSLHAIQEDLTAALHSNQKKTSQILKVKDSRLKQKIELRKLSFSYPGSNKKVIDSVSLNIPVGSLIGIAGGSGAGKTTLVDLILGLFEPVSGQIQLDGELLDGSNLSWWQTNIGYVPQSGFIADGTIARNIAFGISENNIDLQRVRDMARIAQISEFIETELPNQYETLVGDRGVRLSGGQCQRLSIARALYHNPDILILDEATSALDGITEDKVMNAILQLSEIKTIILIAHRLTTLQECDNIFLMDKGRLIDQGSFQFLIDNNKNFQRMAKKMKNEE